MFQKFYTDTLGGRYIKSLLAQTPLPVFESVVNGDHVIAGCYYVYRNYIIKCNTSGVLMVSEMENLYPSDTLYPSVFLFPAYGIRAATFYVKSLVGDNIAKTHATYVSKTNYYDSETHYHLGRYLRYLLTTTGLNLFPYYNCYNGTYLPDVELSELKHDVTIKRVTKQSYNVIAIPILFGHTYTIAIDCPTKVLMRAAVYDDTGYLEEDNLNSNLVKILSNSGRVFSRLKFNEPVQFRIETDDIAAMMMQRDLYLVIQLPQDNNSSIVVLENYVDNSGIKCDENGVRKVEGVLNPSLLAMNSRSSYAFSDRLMEYILNNVTHKDDPIVQNIAHSQTVVGNLSQDYKRSFLRGERKKGIWDNTLPQYVYTFAEEYSKSNNIYDQDGNINKDILSVMYSKGGI